MSFSRELCKQKFMNVSKVCPAAPKNTIERWLFNFVLLSVYVVVFFGLI